MNDDIRIIANKLGVSINSLSAPFLNAYFLSLTPPEVEINMDETLPQNPGYEREKTIWRPNEVELYYTIRWKIFLSYLPPSIIIVALSVLIKIASSLLVETIKCISILLFLSGAEPLPLPQVILVVLPALSYISTVADVNVSFIVYVLLVLVYLELYTK